MISPRTRKFAKRAGTVLVALVVLDLIAATATVALGLTVLRK